MCRSPGGTGAIAQDTLLLSVDALMMMGVRHVSKKINWNREVAELRIDTTPIVAQNAQVSQHLHGAESLVLADNITQRGQDSWLNFSGLPNTMRQDHLLDNNT